MFANRRAILSAGLSTGLGFAAVAVPAAAKEKLRVAAVDTGAAGKRALPQLVPNSGEDQTATLQALIDDAATRGAALFLPEGTFRAGEIKLGTGSCLIGQSRRTQLEFLGGDAFVSAENADNVVIRGIVFNGKYKPHAEDRGIGMIDISNSKDVVIEDCEIVSALKAGIALVSSSGRIAGNMLRDCLDLGIKSTDATGLVIRDNVVDACGNNGILVWRTEQGEDGTIVSQNRVKAIRHDAGGTGEYGNGINVFRAGGVIVEGNRITDCAYSAVRGNAASNIQITGNNCARMGEVALYAEFGFEGALISNNIVDGAACGISVTNFSEGGRLAVIQGNLIRNLYRREEEKQDKRGEGITVEADAAVTGNTIEGAPTVGIQIGWGKFMRDVAATGNVIRNARVGISVSDDADAGACLIASNLISGAKDGAIRRMAHGVVSGPDLAKDGAGAGRITVAGNVSV